MNKIILALVSLMTMTFPVLAQEVASNDSLNMAVEERSPEVFSHDALCSVSVENKTCEVTIRFQSDTYPVEFINGGKTLLRLEAPPEGPIVVVSGIKFKRLPTKKWVREIDGVKYEEQAAGWYYQLDMKNSTGRTILIQEFGD